MSVTEQVAGAVAGTATAIEGRTYVIAMTTHNKSTAAHIPPPEHPMTLEITRSIVDHRP